MPVIKGFLETSFLDWPGRVCSVIFLGGCNFRCPFCHNHPLVLEPEHLESLEFTDVLARLGKFKKWLGGVCISGGEPTLDLKLPEIARQLKQENWQVKLDTNGTRPQVLARLLSDGLIDMVSMDVKAPLEEQKYNRCAGTRVDLDQIKWSISLLKESGVEHEFRMTVLPALHSEQDIGRWSDTLAAGGCSRLKIQNFNPRTTMNSSFAQEKPFSREKFAELQQLVA